MVFIGLIWSEKLIWKNTKMHGRPYYFMVNTYKKHGSWRRFSLDLWLQNRLGILVRKKWWNNSSTRTTLWADQTRSHMLLWHAEFFWQIIDHPRWKWWYSTFRWKQLTTIQHTSTSGSKSWDMTPALNGSIICQQLSCLKLYHAVQKITYWCLVGNGWEWGVLGWWHY